MITKLELEQELGRIDENGNRTKGKYKILSHTKKKFIEECCFCGLNVNEKRKGILFYNAFYSKPYQGPYTELPSHDDICECSLGQNNCPFLRMYVQLQNHLDMPHPIRY